MQERGKRGILARAGIPDLLGIRREVPGQSSGEALEAEALRASLAYWLGTK